MDTLPLLVTLASGISLGYLGHALSSKRERDAREHTVKLARDARLASYKAFLVGWEQKIEKTTDEAAIKSLYFNEAASQFRMEAAKVRRDFAEKAEFNRLDDALSRLSPAMLDAGPNSRRETVADAVRALIRYVQAA